MRIAVTGATGNIGSVVAATLMSAGVEVRLLVRQPGRLPSDIAHRAEIREGSHLDARWVARAVDGCDALFWLTPPAFTDDILRFTASAAAAAGAASQRVGRVVVISGAYCDRADLGLATWLRFVETAVLASSRNATILRPGLFMENFLFASESIRAGSLVAFPASPHARSRFIATRDIAAAAAARLLDADWNGHGALAVMGPERLSFAEATSQLGAALSRSLKYVEASPAETRAGMHALPAAFVDAYIHMYQGFNRLFLEGIDPSEPTIVGATTFAALASEVLAPRLN
ncbi:MAG: NAD(P)H-binding protein [Planctomycetota bacterium]|nr:NAD(P)H-binding protein [Planctomycetota bacterium]